MPKARDMDGNLNAPQLVKIVPVSHFLWCSCDTPGYDEPHLKIRTVEVPLKPGQAVAVSYGIGDFDRRLHTTEMIMKMSLFTWNLVVNGRFLT